MSRMPAKAMATTCVDTNGPCRTHHPHPQAQLVLLKDRPPIRYDVLSINLGITPDLRAIPGALQHATPVKPIFSFVERIDALLRRARDSTSPPRIAVIGGGAGGVELAMALAHRLAQERAAADAAIRWATLCGAPVAAVLVT